MRDAVAFQEKGIPTVTVCHQYFETAAKALATSLGKANLPFAIIPDELLRSSHNGNLDSVKKRASIIADKVEDVLRKGQPLPVKN